jgi:hypothetical protein
MLAPFLLDPDAMNHRTSDASSHSTSRGNFRDKVIARDETCVMTASGIAYAEACNIIPHAKGHQVRSNYLLNHSEFSFDTKYLINLANHRHEIINPPFEDINDTRNGILLHNALHGGLGASEVAFLQVIYST